jgi:predicted AAA+ superfamily ATPase
MDEAKLQRVLARFNPWWRGEPVQSSLYDDEHRRRDFDRLVERARTAQIVTLVGPRQVGKSTMLGQYVDHLLEEGHDPSSVLYATTEASTISSDAAHILSDILNVYETRVLGRSFEALDSPVYILVDEVQKATDWGDTVKLYADRYDDLNFLLTGSVSTLITAETNETLVGRADEQVIVPMKFVDYLRYEGVLSDAEVREQSRAHRDELRVGVQNGDHQKVGLALSNAMTQLEGVRPEIRNTLENYLLRGGYPGYFDLPAVGALRELDEDLYRVVQGDLATVFGVDKRRELMAVLEQFADSTGNKLSLRGLANDLNLNRETVREYVDYLEEFFLVYRCQHYTPGAGESRKQPMAYVSDVGHLNALRGTAPEGFPQAADVGPILETAVCDHLRRLQFNFSEFRDADVVYSETTGEVDFVLDGPNYLVPIEVKHGNPRHANLRSIERFMEAKDAPVGFVINNADVFSQDGGLISVPAWLFFYLC